MNTADDSLGTRLDEAEDRIKALLAERYALQGQVEELKGEAREWRESSALATQKLAQAQIIAQGGTLLREPLESAVIDAVIDLRTQVDAANALAIDEHHQHGVTLANLGDAQANLLALQVELGRVRGALERAALALESVMDREIAQEAALARDALSSPVPAAEVGEAIQVLLALAEGETVSTESMNEAVTTLTLGLGPKETSR